MHIDCSRRGVEEINLDELFISETERAACAVVKSLDLSHNQLSKVSRMQPFASLTSLDLSHNRIISCSGLPLSLTRLDLSCNSITTLNGLAVLPHLVELDISRNGLSSLSSLPPSGSIRVLRIAHNSLRTLDGIHVLPSLAALDVEGNTLESYEAVAPALAVSTLRFLVAKGNPVAADPAYPLALARTAPQLQTIDGVSVQDALRDPPHVPHTTTHHPSVTSRSAFMAETEGGTAAPPGAVMGAQLSGSMGGRGGSLYAGHGRGGSARGRGMGESTRGGASGAGRVRTVDELKRMLRGEGGVEGGEGGDDGDVAADGAGGGPQVVEVGGVGASAYDRSPPRVSPTSAAARDRVSGLLSHSARGGAAGGEYDAVGGGSEAASLRAALEAEYARTARLAHENELATAALSASRMHLTASLKALTTERKTKEELDGDVARLKERAKRLARELGYARARAAAR